MKLINKLNIFFLITSAAALIIIGISIYIALQFVLAEEHDDKLLDILKQSTKQISSENIIPTLPPYIEVYKVNDTFESKSFSDTLMQEVDDDDDEIFRQLVAIKEINNTFYKIIIRESEIESDDILENISTIILIGFILLL